jgi:cytochrome c oxidase cbb3-type subunit IV
MTSGIITSLLLILFVAGCVWLFSPKRKKAFDDAARLALDDPTEEHK